jgi:hypothetical protein
MELFGNVPRRTWRHVWSADGGMEKSEIRHLRGTRESLSVQTHWTRVLDRLGPVESHALHTKFVEPQDFLQVFLTISLLAANCPARRWVELNGSSFTSRATCAETSIKGLPGRTSSWRSVLCALNSRTQYFTAPSEYESLPYTSDSLWWIFFLPLPCLQ